MTVNPSIMARFILYAEEEEHLRQEEGEIPKMICTEIEAGLALVSLSKQSHFDSLNSALQKLQRLEGATSTLTLGGIEH